jgi:hypothetical protein
VEKHGFSVVVRMVSESDLVETETFKKASEKPVPQNSSRFFDGMVAGRGKFLNVRFFSEKWYLPVQAMSADERLVQIRGFSPKAVMKVRDRKRQILRFTNPAEKVQQGHGIAAAGDPHQNSVTGPEQCVLSAIRFKMMDQFHTKKR